MPPEKLETMYMMWDTENNCYVKFKNKVAWTTQAGAANAYNIHSKYPLGRYTEQSRYRVIKLDCRYLNEDNND